MKVVVRSIIYFWFLKILYTKAIEFSIKAKLSISCQMWQFLLWAQEGQAAAPGFSYQRPFDFHFW